MVLVTGGHTQVAGATTVRITTTDAAAALVRKAATARAVESTAMNAVSSRSHSIFMLNITGKHAASATTLRGALNLVDLAGRCSPKSMAPFLLSTRPCLRLQDVHSTCLQPMHWALTDRGLVQAMQTRSHA